MYIKRPISKLFYLTFPCQLFCRYIFLFNHRCKKNEPFSFKVDLGRFKNKKNKKRRKNKNSAKNTVTNWKILDTILDKETNMLHDFDLPEPSADLFEIHKSESWEIHLAVSPTSPETQDPLTTASRFPVRITLLYEGQTWFISLDLAETFVWTNETKIHTQTWFIMFALKHSWPSQTFDWHN